MLHPDEWGTAPWYPLLALGALEHKSAMCPFKGMKKVLKALKASRPQREWLIGNYYWALWKWRMKEIHDDAFRFMPASCVDSLKKTLLTPCPEQGPESAARDNIEVPGAKTRLTDGAYT